MICKLIKLIHCRRISPRRQRIRRDILAIIALILFFFLWFNSNKHISLSNYPTRNETKPNPKTILLWTDMLGNPKWNMEGKLDTSQPFELLNCEITNCILTRNHLKLEQADAVLFYFHDELNTFGYNRPKKRRNDQIFMISMMSPSNYFKNSNTPHSHWLMNSYKNISDNYFNWTMNFQKSSDIYNPYGVFHKLAVKNQSRINRDYWSGKTKGAFWAVSHCQTNSTREKLALELTKYIPVEMSGKCHFDGINHFDKCEKHSWEFFDTFNLNCEEAVVENFKFYFAFENTLCPDYITEKFYRTATMDIIPVVFNGADMTQIAPDHSYIDAKDFKTVQELGEYLQKVASDKDLYNSYFTWKSEFVAIYTLGLGFCDLCSKLNDFDPVRDGKVLKDVRKWLQGDCKAIVKPFLFS